MTQPLLKHQLKKLGLGETAPPSLEVWQQFLELVDQTYMESVQLQADLSKFRLGIERSGDAFFLTKIDGSIIYVNPAFEKIYGYSREEALGKTPRILKSGLIPQEQYQHFWQALLARQVVAGEFTNKTKDGRLVNIEGSNNPILDEDGNLIGFLSIHRDITVRKQAEKSLMKRADELICLNDIGREMEGAPPVLDLLQWVTERIPAAMQFPELCKVAIEYDGQVNGLAEAVDLPTQMTHGLYVAGQIQGRIYIAYTEKHDFLNEESALLGGIATRLSGYIENRRLLEQAQSALAEVEVTQRRYTLQAWETYRARRMATSYQQTREGVPRLGDALPPEADRAVVERKPVAVSAPPTLAADDQVPVPEARSSLIVPLTVRDTVIGVLGLQETDEERAWTPEEIALVEAIGEQLAQAAERLRLFDETQQQAARERRVGEIGDKIRAAQSLEEALQIAVKEVGLSLEASQTTAQLAVKTENLI